MKEKTANMHNELLELIATLSNGTLSDRSSVCASCVLQNTLQFQDQVYSEANGLQNRWENEQVSSMTYVYTFVF
jgi:hypothetical protein